MAVRVRRVYEPADPADGLRVLVDRLWPRGLTKERAAVDVWLKEVAPSNGLRRRFHAGELDAGDFAVEYRRELSGNRVLGELRALADNHSVLTLLTATRSLDHNHVVVLLERLDAPA